MRSTRLLGSIILLALTVSTAVAQGPPPPPPPPPLTPLPPPPQPAGNLITAAKASLGKLLFWDEQLSSTRTMACGSCHQAPRGGSDPRSILGSAAATHPGNDGLAGTPDDITGSPGVVRNNADGSFSWSSTFGMQRQVTSRLAPSFINAGYAPELFWDGRAGTTFRDPETNATILAAGGALENQVLGPPVSDSEMAHIGRSWPDVVARVSGAKPLAISPSLPEALASYIGSRSYAELFDEAFGTPGITASRIAMAIATYERTLFSTQTPFDSLIAGTAVLRPQEQAGFQLFGALACGACHAGSLTSDNAYHYIGVRPAAEDSGRMAVSHAPTDLGSFRTPSLRNVSLRGTFFHNGRFSTLAEVVDFYDRGGDFNAPNKDPRIRPLNLNPTQKAQLLAFLGRPLTDPRVASGAAPFDRPALYGESGLVPLVLAGGTPGGSGLVPQSVALEPPFAGNPQFTVGVHGALGGAPAVLVIGETEPPVSGSIPEVGSFARLETTLQGSGASDGFGSATLAIPDNGSLYGKTLYGRWYVSDPGALDGVAASPAFSMQVFGTRGATEPLPVNPPTPAPRKLKLYAGQPNPFPSRTTIRFDLAAASSVELDVFDVTGRAVRQLYRRTSVAPGSYSVAWDGRDDAGQSVPRGMYFYRLKTDQGSETQRVVRLD